MKKSNVRKYILYLVFAILFLIRLINISNPPLDYSSWRQVDTDSIARNFIEYKFNIFYPQLNYDGPMPNYVQLELQVTTFIIAILYKIFGYSPICARIVPILFFMGSCYYLFLIVRRKSGFNAAIMTVLLYGILPINIIYSRNIMPESALMFFMLGGIYYFILFIDKNKNAYYFLSTIFTTLAVLTKVPAAFIGIPMIYLAVKKYGVNIFLNIKLIIFPVIIFGLSYSYFAWLGNIAEYKFVSEIGSLMIMPNFLNSIFKEQTLKYLAQQFLGKVFTVPGIVLFAVGIVQKKKKEEYFYYFWLFGAVLHIIIVDAVIHLDYYLMVITPIITIFMGITAAKMFAIKKYSYILLISIVIIILTNVIFLKDAYSIEKLYITIGNHVSQYTKKSDLIIINNDSPELFYTSDRKGFRLYGDLLTTENIEKLISEGANYFIPYKAELDKDIKNYLERKFYKITFPDGYFIYKLSLY